MWLYQALLSVESRTVLAAAHSGTEKNSKARSTKRTFLMHPPLENILPKGGNMSRKLPFEGRKPSHGLIRISLAEYPLHPVL